MLKKGLVQVYTGSTELFNFAPLGLSLRAAGQGLKTLVTCFATHEFMDGAEKASSLLKPHLVIDHTPVEGDASSGSKIRDRVLASFRNARTALCSGQYDMLILNGINPLIKKGILPLGEIIQLMEKRPPNVELVLSGAEAPEELIDRADLVTEMVVSRPGGAPNEGVEHSGPPSPIEVITGNGKGKTTYCLGKAMLRSCTGVRSSILQFIKSPSPYGEIKAIARLPHLEIKTMGEGFLHTDRPEERKKHLKAARMAWEECLREIFSLKYGLVALDEINTATYYGLVHADRVREMLFLKPHGLELLLSGRNAHLQVRGASSILIEMREIKHPYRKGIKARKGIEY